VEVPVVAEPGQRIRQRKPHCPERADDRALVELDREQRADERDRQERRALPEDDQHQRRRGHQRERHDRPAHVRARETEQRPVRADGDDGRDQDQVHAVLCGGGGADARQHAARALTVEGRGHGSRRRRREREDGDVVGDPHRRAVLEQLCDQRREEDDQQPRGPAEKHDGGDAEHERQRDAAGVDAFDRDREAVGECRGQKERRQAEERRRLVWRDGKGDRGSAGDSETGRADGHDHCEEPRRRQDAARHVALPVQVVVDLEAEAAERNEHKSQNGGDGDESRLPVQQREPPPRGFTGNAADSQRCRARRHPPEG
jgi:hypothetical protein